MSQGIQKTELVERVSRRARPDIGATKEIVHAVLEAIYQALEQGEYVSLRDFGTLSIRPERHSQVLKFNPSRRLRRLFGAKPGPRTVRGPAYVPYLSMSSLPTQNERAPLLVPGEKATKEVLGSRVGFSWLAQE